MIKHNESKEDFLKNQTHEQLEIFVKNGDLIQDNLRERLFLLSGCWDFGGEDGTNGACVECYYNNRELHERCCLFQSAMHIRLLNQRKKTQDRNVKNQTCFTKAEKQD